MELTEKQIKVLRNQQQVLRKIAEGEDVFFNIVNYEQKLGLVKSRNVYGKDPWSGERIVIDTNYYLTTKGKMILNANI